VLNKYFCFVLTLYKKVQTLQPSFFPDNGMHSPIIPKIIHQTYKSRACIPERWARSPAEWKRHHPDWEYRFWSDADLRELICTHFSWFLAKYDSFPHFIQRVDAARYFILYKYGGVYSDLDIYPCRNIEKWIMTGNSVVLVRSGNVKHCLTNSLMASAPGADVWNRVFYEMYCTKPPWWALTKHFEVMTTTGPMMLDRVVSELSDKTIGLMPTSLFSDNSETIDRRRRKKRVMVHLRGNSWCSADSFVLGALYRHLTAVIVVVSALTAIFVYFFGYKLWNTQRLLSKCTRQRVKIANG
jgi:mannosyltransferase OCH1-like enzyme